MMVPRNIHTSPLSSGAQHIPPYGDNSLVNLMVNDEKEKETLLKSCKHTQECSDRNACDIELLTVGAFSPLTGFMNQEEYNSVVKNMRLPNNLLFGLPIVFDTRNDAIQVGDKIKLTYKDQVLGVLDVNSKWQPDKVFEAKQSYGTTSLEHPAVQMISMERGNYYLGGRVFGFEIPKRVFPCLTPAEVRSQILPAGADVVVFQCRNPIHRAHYELFSRALTAPNVRPGAVCLVHPTCGPTQDDDIPGVIRFHTYEVLRKELGEDRIKWAYLPYSMHLAGPREALQHMILRRNYGCTHFIVGRDMAGCKSSLTGEDFYGVYDAQQMALSVAKELGMQVVPSADVVFTEEKGYVVVDEAKKDGLHVMKLSGTKFRQMLRAGQEIPEWFAFKSVVEVLRKHIAPVKKDA
nr:ATP-sulfurylase (APS) [Polytomella parva]